MAVRRGNRDTRFAATATAAAQDISVNFGQSNELTERVIQMIALLTVLSLLRTALGTATASPNAVIVIAALF